MVRKRIQNSEFRKKKEKREKRKDSSYERAQKAQKQEKNNRHGLTLKELLNKYVQ